MNIFQRKPGGSYYVRFEIKGKAYLRSCRTNIKHLAAAYGRQIRQSALREAMDGARFKVPAALASITHALEELQNGESVIYFLIRKDVVVYVGQSCNLLARVGTHFEEKEKQFDRVLWYHCGQETRLLEEAMWISRLAPEYNVNGALHEPN